jgi:adenine-specific DNA-methyltransferase
MSTTSAAITDSKFKALKDKLRELFELDKSDLDFGIYRIIAAKNKEVTEFLDRQLKDVVRATLAEHGAGATDQVQVELDKAIEQARTLGADPETLPKVKELRTRLETAGGAASADLEADIYNHLYAFFGRYYEEGDFISQRRYKGDTYAIPYSGEEVTLHWANKDQYYIKSGEWHKDYRFRVGGDKTVRFKLVEATQEVGNNKEADDSKRRYILANDQPVEESAHELTLRFEFRTPTQAERDRAANGAVAVFGGDYAKASNPKKGDEREQFCADAEQRAVAAISAGWKSLVATAGAAATNDKPGRTLLGKHLDHFSARNTFDYFIHKDLGGFLRRELDFYIKNEVVRLDDLETLPADHLQRIQGKVKAIRTVASRIIAFLAAIEDFQKKMWLKKKFVLNTSWLVTVDRTPPALRDVVAANKAQWEEWERLGFRPESEGETDLFGGAAWGTRRYLDACDKLVVDTRLYGFAFASELLSDPTALSGVSTFAEATCATLICGENSQALRVLVDCLRSSVDVCFIDPPYNTGVDGFRYKDRFQRSTWLAMASERCEATRPLLAREGLFVSSIDFVEVSRLRILLDGVFGSENFLADIAWEKRYTRSNNAKLFYSLKDTLLAYRVSPELSHLREARSEKSEANYSNPDNDPRGPWISSSYVNPATKEDRPNLAYGIARPGTQEVVVHPTHAWKYDRETHEGHVSSRRLYWGVDGGYEYPRLKSFLSEAKDGMVPIDVWHHGDTGTTDEGGRVLKDLFGGPVFDNPKPPTLIRRVCTLSPASSDKLYVLDFFAGSGTTGHAILDRRRTDGRSHEFLLVELGEHFYTVLRPRMAKMLYSGSWAEGRAQSHCEGLSGLIKSFALESYEDALNNLPVPSGTLLDDRTAEEKDALITYSLDLELGPSLLNLDAFRDPWGYSINAQLAGDVEMKRHRVDLVETFNYLIGLKVHAYGPMERYSADFERVEHADGLGRLKVAGRLRRDAGGPYVFQRVEGELNPASNGGVASRVLVVWRKLSDDPEKDAAVLDAWMTRHRESTRERSEHRDYHRIYINGPVTLPQPTAEIRTVYPTEGTFKLEMFKDSEGGA